MDSFKGSVTSIEAGEAVKKGIEEAYEHDVPQVFVSPIADGGEGTIDSIFYQNQEPTSYSFVQGPLFEKSVIAKYGILNQTAILEIAETSGITLVKKELLNPWEATTYGFGEQIRSLVKKGYRDFLIGLGGSATNDAGIGMLSALGVDFQDENGKSLGYLLKDMRKLAKIDCQGLLPELKECRFKLASDVRNVLCGENGATYVFGKQKGVKENEMQEIDELLLNFSRLTEEVTHKQCREHEGSGAAGGIAFSFLSYFDSRLVSGFEEIASLTGLEEKIKQADLVVTGEGMLDSQSLMGKVPVAVASMAKKHGKKVIALAGGVSKDAEKCNQMGISAFFPTIQRIANEQEILSTQSTKEAIRKTTQQLFRFAQLFKGNLNK